MSESKHPTHFSDPHALREPVHSGENVIIVDIRGPEKFASGHVERAISIPSDQLVAKAGGFPADANIVASVIWADSAAAPPPHNGKRWATTKPLPCVAEAVAGLTA
jgi:rhodanese-related sulfurtransferase